MTRHLGGDFPRPDAPDKVSGRALYVHDLSRPGMLHAAIRHSDHPHARILRVDVSRALRVPGVRAVLTGFDTPQIRIGFLRDNFALKRDKVRARRDEIAAVAAVDPNAAREAAALVRVEYEELPAVFDPREAMAEGAPLVHETDPRGRPQTTNVLPLRFRHRSGDLEAGRRAAKFVVEDEYSTPRIQQSCMGTAGCIAELDTSGNLTLWAKTQIPFLAQRDFTRALADMGLPDRNVRVIVPALGGGFGTGLDTHAYEYIAILLAHRTGKPVKVLHDRAEEFAFLSPRQSATVRIRQGCDAEGRLTLREVDVLQDNGAYASWGATYPSVMMLPATSLYRVPAVRFDSTLVYTNNTYCQAMRGYGNPELTWALESNLDDLGVAAGIDPLDLRRLNCNEPGETTPMGLRVRTCGLRECLERAATRVGWKEKRGRGRKTARGVGMASLMHVGGSGRIYRSDATGVILKIDDFGTVHVHAGGVEMGQGHHSALTRMVAEALGVLPEQVLVHATDTATCPWDVGTHASRGAFTAGQAILRAAAKAKEKIFALAEPILAEIFPSQALALAGGAGRPVLELADGRLGVRGVPDASVELGKALRAIHFREGGDMITVEAFFDPSTELPDWEKGVGNLSATYAYGVQAAEVEVDEQTGEVRILRMVAVHDVGKILNLQTLRGQTYGALAQGIGYALTEEVQTRRGRILNAGFRDYKIPTIHEMAFPIDLEFVETDDPSGPFGAKGVGEPGLVPTAPAIANAIYDAVGIRVRDLPITPEKVLAAIRARDAR